MSGYQSCRGETKQKSSPQELEVVILDKDPEVVSTNSAGGKLVRSTVMETKGKTEKKEAVKAENKTKSPTNVAEKDEMKIRDIAVGKKKNIFLYCCANFTCINSNLLSH